MNLYVSSVLVKYQWYVLARTSEVIIVRVLCLHDLEYFNYMSVLLFETHKTQYT